MASKEEVRAWARQKRDGASITSDQQAAINRTTGQAGTEGRLITRILGGSNE